MMTVLAVTGGLAAPCFLMFLWKAGTCSTFSVCAAIIDRLQLWLQQQCFEPAAKTKPDPVTSGTLDIAKMQPRRMWLNIVNLKRSKHCMCAHFFFKFYLKKSKAGKSTQEYVFLLNDAAVWPCSPLQHVSTFSWFIIYKKLDLTITLKI